MHHGRYSLHHRISRSIAAAALAAAVFAGTSASAQCPVSVLTAGLRAPAKIILSSQKNLLVAEGGYGTNSGRVSVIDPQSGLRRTLLDGLPAALAAPSGDPSGPSGLAMQGRTLYVTIGLGDAVANGPLPGSFVPNPNPSSPIFSSVLALNFSANVEHNTAGFALSPADQIALKNGDKINLSNGGGDKMSIELVADFPDYVPEPRPGLPEAVRQSNPFGAAVFDDHLYVADASSNVVWDIDLVTGAQSVLTAFAPLANNRGFGPPVVEAVPDSIQLVGNQLLVTLLSGFPFPLGNAQVRAVDPATGTNTPFITGLTSAIDVTADGAGFLTLEFSTDMLVPNTPGRLRSYASPVATPTVVAGCLVTPTGMVREPKTGAVFVTEIFTGRVMKVSP